MREAGNRFPLNDLDWRETPRLSSVIVSVSPYAIAVEGEEVVRLPDARAHASMSERGAEAARGYVEGQVNGALAWALRTTEDVAQALEPPPFGHRAAAIRISIAASADVPFEWVDVVARAAGGLDWQGVRLLADVDGQVEPLLLPRDRLAEYARLPKPFGERRGPNRPPRWALSPTALRCDFGERFSADARDPGACADHAAAVLGLFRAPRAHGVVLEVGRDVAFGVVASALAAMVPLARGLEIERIEVVGDPSAHADDGLPCGVEYPWFDALAVEPCSATSFERHWARVAAKPYAAVEPSNVLNPSGTDRRGR